jgi:hypothetical protein
MMRGSATRGRERFEFTIEPSTTTGYVLTVRCSIAAEPIVAAQGFWPSIEKAKRTAETTARKLLRGAVVKWEDERA